MRKSIWAGTAFATFVAAAAVAACGLSTSTCTAGPIATSRATDPRICIASGFVSETIASVDGARELVALPNGDMLVGTAESQIFIVSGAENAGAVSTPHAFVTLPDSPAQGIAISPDHTTIFASTEYDVFRIPYKPGDQSEPSSDIHRIAQIRSGPIAPGSDGDVHNSSSVAAASSKLYVGVGSSCNACVEVDPTRASIQVMNLDGSGMHTLATRIRNPIALALNPVTKVLWAGGAGQDKLPYHHPFEFMDAVSLQTGAPVDYGWPDCEENRNSFGHGANCSSVAVPRVEFPAYSTLIGAAFYPATMSGRYAFPTAYRGGLFVTSHGSWHCCPSTPPEVAYVAMSGDTPNVRVDWGDPNAQWSPFMWNFGRTWNPIYIGRPTGIAVGSQGSLFVADDKNGVIYRIRPVSASRPRDKTR